MPRDRVDLIVGYRHLEDALDALLPFSDLLHVYEEIPYLAVRCEKGDMKALAGQPSVSSVDLSHLVRAYPTTRSPSALWNLARIGAHEAHQLSRGEHACVAIIDTGVSVDHPELALRFGELLGYNVISPDRPPTDRNGHGTHVAGIVAGESTGVAPGCTLYAVKVLGDNGSGSEADVIAGLEWALQAGADIANLSLGSSQASRAFEAMCRRCHEAGMHIVAAAGNDGRGADYPAAFGESVIAVAAVDRDCRHADFSNIWRTNDISAPGVGITSSVPGGYESFSGTSMAAPHVAGSLALALGTPSLEELLGDHCERLPWSGSDAYRDVFGAGLVRADWLVRAARGGEKRKRLLADKRR